MYNTLYTFKDDMAFNILALLVDTIIYLVIIFFCLGFLVNAWEECKKAFFDEKFRSIVIMIVSLVIVFALAKNLILRGCGFLCLGTMYFSGNYEIVEGYVEDFYATDTRGHDKPESFNIGGVYFSYEKYGESTCAYHEIAEDGGVINSNGQHLKIGYVYCKDYDRNLIVYIGEYEE